jgi:copper ion binding protein
MTERNLFVPDISCDHCKTSIEGTVSELDGVASVIVDIPARRVEVSFDESEVSLDRIIEVMGDIGYEVAADG